MLLVRCADEAYAFPASYVTQIVSARSVKGVPGTPAYIRGLANLRGQLVPVVLLAEQLGLAHPEQGDKASLVVVQHEDLCVGLQVCRDCEVFDLAEDAAIEKLGSLSDSSAGFVLGVTVVRDEPLTLIHIPSYLARIEEDLLEGASL
ncbi:MAG: chemotaxis protein CheW [Phycisphaerae bacterium]